MTAGTRRNGTSKFGPFGWETARPGAPRGQAQDDSWDYFAYDVPAVEAYGTAEAYPDGVDDGGADDPKRRRKAERYTGRHASRRGKTARTWWAGKVVPVAAAAVTLAAGTTAAAYALGSGGPKQAAQLNAAMLPAGKTATATVGAGKANAASSSLVKAAKPTPSSRPSAAPSASASATPSATPSAPATTQAPAPSATPSGTAAATTLSCDSGDSLLPQNVTAIVSFLLANGYSDNAAAGIAGNIYQESKGDPESIGTGGGGLIGWTPLPAGFVTGDVSADLQLQLQQILVYNQGWASYLPALNAAATPADAAYIYVTDFERAGIPATATREASADAVASACGI